MLSICTAIFFLKMNIFPRLLLWSPLSVMVLHLGIAFVFTLGMFPWVSIVAWLLFFPPWFWDRASHLIGHAKSCAFEKGASGDQASPDPIIPAPWSRKIFYDLTPLVLLAMSCWWPWDFSGCPALGSLSPRGSPPPSTSCAYAYARTGLISPLV